MKFGKKGSTEIKYNDDGTGYFYLGELNADGMPQDGRCIFLGRDFLVMSHVKDGDQGVGNFLDMSHDEGKF